MVIAVIASHSDVLEDNFFSFKSGAGFFVVDQIPIIHVHLTVCMINRFQMHIEFAPQRDIKKLL